VPQDPNDPRVKDYYRSQRIKDEALAAGGNKQAAAERDKIYSKLPDKGRQVSQEAASRPGMRPISHQSEEAGRTYGVETGNREDPEQYNDPLGLALTIMGGPGVGAAGDVAAAVGERAVKPIVSKALDGATGLGQMLKGFIDAKAEHEAAGQTVPYNLTKEQVARQATFDKANAERAEQERLKKAYETPAKPGVDKPQAPRKGRVVKGAKEITRGQARTPANKDIQVKPKEEPKAEPPPKPQRKRKSKSQEAPKEKPKTEMPPIPKGEGVAQKQALKEAGRIVKAAKIKATSTRKVSASKAYKESNVRPGDNEAAAVQGKMKGAKTTRVPKESQADKMKREQGLPKDFNPFDQKQVADHIDKQVKAHLESAKGKAQIKDKVDKALKEVKVTKNGKETKGLDPEKKAAADRVKERVKKNQAAKKPKKPEPPKPKFKTKEGGSPSRTATLRPAHSAGDKIRKARPHEREDYQYNSSGKARITGKHVKKYQNREGEPYEDGPKASSNLRRLEGNEKVTRKKPPKRKRKNYAT